MAKGRVVFRVAGNAREAVVAAEALAPRECGPEVARVALEGAPDAALRDVAARAEGQALEVGPGVDRQEPEPRALDPRAEDRHRQERAPREPADPRPELVVEPLGGLALVGPPQALREAWVCGRVGPHVPARVESEEDQGAQVVHGQLPPEVQVPDLERVRRGVVVVARCAHALQQALRQPGVPGRHGVPHRGEERNVPLVDRPLRVGLVKAIRYGEHPRSPFGIERAHRALPPQTMSEARRP